MIDDNGSRAACTNPLHAPFTGALHRRICQNAAKRLTRICCFSSGNSVRRARSWWPRRRSPAFRPRGAPKGRMRLLVSNGVKAALVAVQPGCETQTALPGRRFGHVQLARADGRRGSVRPRGDDCEGSPSTPCCRTGSWTPRRNDGGEDSVSGFVRQNATAPNVRTAAVVRKALLAPLVTWPNAARLPPFTKDVEENARHHRADAGRRTPSRARRAPRPSWQRRPYRYDADPISCRRAEDVGALPAEFQGE